MKSRITSDFSFLFLIILITLCLAPISLAQVLQDDTLAQLDIDKAIMPTLEPALDKAQIKALAVWQINADLLANKSHLNDFLDNLYISLMNSGKYRVVDRKNLDLLIQEQKFSQSDLFDPGHMKEFGKLSGVDAFLYGDIREVYGRYTLSLKLLNVTTARAIWAIELAISSGEKSPQEFAIEQAIAAAIDSLRKAASTLSNTKTLSIWKILKDDSPDIIAMDKLNTTLIQSGIFDVVDRENLESLLSEQKLSLTGLVDPNKIKELGKIYGVDAFLFGKERMEGGKTVFALQMIDVDTATVIWAEEAGKTSTADTSEPEPTEPIDRIAYAAKNSLEKTQNLKVNTIAIGNIIGAPPELSEKLSIRLTKSGRFKVIDRSMLDVILKEQKLSLTGIIAPEKMKNIGSLYGIDAFIFGRKVETLSKEKTVVLKLIDVNTGVILWSEILGDTEDDLVRIARHAAKLNTAKLKTERSINTISLWRIKGYNNIRDNEGLMDMMAAEIVKQNRFKIIDRQNLQTLLEEQKFTQSGLVNPEKMKEFGRLYGIDAFIYGDSSYGLRLKLADALTATIIWTGWTDFGWSQWYTPVLESYKSLSDDMILSLYNAYGKLNHIDTLSIWQISDDTKGNFLASELINMLGENICKNTRFKLVDRDTLKAILKEQNFNGEGAIDPTYRQEIRLQGIDAYLFGRLSESDRQTRTLVLKLLDVETGELLWINKSSADWLYQLDGMVEIPEGSFLMGYSEKRQQVNDLQGSWVSVGENKEKYKVWVDSFLIDACPVTNAQYRQFVASTGHDKPVSLYKDDEAIYRDGYYNQIFPWKADKFNKPDQPVVGIKYEDALAYAKWAGKRLPTEAEWEKAARGGLIGKLYPWGDTLSHDMANYVGTSGKDIWECTSPVGSFPPNAYGLYDMAGNVHEWCESWNHEWYESRNTGRKIVRSEKSYVIRGGSWTNEYYYAGTPYEWAYQDCIERSPPADPITIGFRCVVSGVMKQNTSAYPDNPKN